MNGYIISVVSILIGLIAVFGSLFYIHRTHNEISRIIQAFQTNRNVLASDVRETRESKLISQLKQLIKRMEHESRTSREEKEAVAKLISDLSHQLKTPLANIKLYSELLQDTMLTENEKKEFIIRTGNQAAKMEWLMRALFKTSRLETGMIEFEIGKAELKETIEDSINAVYAQAEKKNIRILIEDYQDICLKHNRKWTAEAISNILENAIKYSMEDSEIHIIIEPMELYTRILIKDQGIGIATEEYNLIFKRFYRSKQVENKEGTGLGLYLSQLILSKQGGYITIDSKIGEGSCFSIFLPNII